MAGPGDQRAAGAGGRAHMRTSQADREQAIDMLKAAFVQGRLSKDEFDVRVGQVLASRTYADLNVLTADIPAGLIRAPLPNAASVSAPKAVRDAVRLMRLGAVLTLAVSVTALVTLGGIRSAAAGDFAAGQWPTVMLTQVGFWLASAPIGAGVWLWLAWANGRGCHWARPAFVAFFGVLSVVLLMGLGSGGGEDALPYTWPVVLAAAVLWLVSLAAMAFIGNPTASPHYQRRAAIPANGPRR